MAKYLFGNVYFKDKYVGILREESGGRVSFTYDSDYLEAKEAACISLSLPLRKEVFVSQNGLPNFFDNLVAEGWLENAQKRLLGKRVASRFELLLNFGFDCVGAVSVIDPENSFLRQDLLDFNDPKELALFTQRASLSGVQPKMGVIEKKGKFYPTKAQELSTHIAKFPSPSHDDMVMNEYLATKAFSKLLPSDKTVSMEIKILEGFAEPALVIERFDREFDKETQQYKKLHFEEINQILDFPSESKYEGSYQTMSQWILGNSGCLPVENYQLYQRILAGLLIGNTDMHFKNFALFHTSHGLRLTPSYDQVSSVLYQYKTIALELAGVKNLPLGSLKPKQCIQLGRDFGLSSELIEHAVKRLESQVAASLTEIEQSVYGAKLLKKNLIQWMEKRWKGTFALIGNYL